MKSSDFKTLALSPDITKHETGSGLWATSALVPPGCPPVPGTCARGHAGRAPAPKGAPLAAGWHSPAGKQPGAQLFCARAHGPDRQLVCERIFKTCNKYPTVYSGPLTSFPVDGQVRKPQQPTQQQPSGVSDPKLYLFFLYEIGRTYVHGVPWSFGPEFTCWEARAGDSLHQSGEGGGLSTAPKARPVRGLPATSVWSTLFRLVSVAVVTCETGRARVRDPMREMG